MRYIVLWRHLWRYRINTNIKTWYPKKPHILTFTLIPSSFFSDHCVKLYRWMCITFQMPLVCLFVRATLQYVAAIRHDVIMNVFGIRLSRLTVRFKMERHPYVRNAVYPSWSGNFMEAFHTGFWSSVRQMVIGQWRWRSDRGNIILASTSQTGTMFTEQPLEMN